MRSYPRNSPEAASRVLALLLFVDGHVSPSELQLMESMGAAGALGLDRDDLPRIVQSMCEDLMISAPSGDLFSGLDSDNPARRQGRAAWAWCAGSPWRASGGHDGRKCRLRRLRRKAA